jgi:hypothetical protein
MTNGLSESDTCMTTALPDQVLKSGTGISDFRASLALQGWHRLNFIQYFLKTQI